MDLRAAHNEPHAATADAPCEELAAARAFETANPTDLDGHGINAGFSDDGISTNPPSTTPIRDLWIVAALFTAAIVFVCFIQRCGATSAALAQINTKTPTSGRGDLVSSRSSFTDTNLAASLPARDLDPAPGTVGS